MTHEERAGVAREALLDDMRRSEMFGTRAEPLVDAVIEEAVQQIRDRVELLTRYAGSVPHSWGSAVKRADVLAVLARHSDGCAGNCGTSYDNPPCPAALDTDR